VVRLLPRYRVMNVRLLTIFAASALFAADVERLAVVQKGQQDFERVFSGATPSLGDAQACVRSAASVIPIATPEEAPRAHFELGWCALAAGTPAQAVAEFDAAIAAWPLQFNKKRPPEPMPSVFPVMAAVARLNGGATEAKDLAPGHICPPSLMPTNRCEEILNIGREWQGYLDLKRNDVDAAARDFPRSAWTDYVAAKQLFRERKYLEAVAAYKRAVDNWKPNPIAPKLDLSAANAELGGAQLLAGDIPGALASLNQALKIDPANARALFLRGRVHDAAAQTDAAIADYNLASRSALAKEGDEAFGESHLYRGISYYRRKEFTQAEDEFDNALNADISETLRADAVAWRRLSAVASGSCEVARKDLEAALAPTSPFFPKEEARAAIARCTDTALRR
jgi:tetratricopeptide (TPR) repeat protein